MELRGSLMLNETLKRRQQTKIVNRTAATAKANADRSTTFKVSMYQIEMNSYNEHYPISLKTSRYQRRLRPTKSIPSEIS